jgi:hypothetical protein
MRFLLVWILLLLSLTASPLTDAAYQAYRAKHYGKALSLYTEASEHGSHRQRIKAYYNLGVMYTKGIGVSKDPAKALKNFRMAALVGQGIVHTMDHTYYRDETLSIMRDTYRYLSGLEKDEVHRKNAKENAVKIDAKLKERKEAKRREKREAQEKKREQKKEIAAYLRKCPSAKIIPSSYRSEVVSIDCKYFKHYPSIMKRYMPWRTKHKKYTESFENVKLLEVDKKIREILSPILKRLQKKRISCYEKAVVKGDLISCDGDYLAELDMLFMTSSVTNFNDALTGFGSPDIIAKMEKENRKRLTDKEKMSAVKDLKDAMKKGISPYLW